MRLKGYPILRNFSKLRQGHNLKPARIRQYRTGPVHKLVKPAKLCYTLSTWAQHKVIGIPENNISTGRFNSFGKHRFNSCCCSNRHKGRSLYLPTGCCDFTTACSSALFLKLERKFCCHFDCSAGCNRLASP